MNVLFPRPTRQLVEAKCFEFDNDPSTQIAERTLASLLQAFPKNTDPARVMAKVIVLDSLYHTRVNAIDFDILVRQIIECSIDALFGQGSLSAVDAIANCPTSKRYFSFATKFCSWHNPEAYPIYDGNVDECLWRYQDRYNFSTPPFHRQDLANSVIFFRVMQSLRAFFELEQFTFREIDKFLWLQGYPTETSGIPEPLHA